MHASYDPTLAGYARTQALLHGGAFQQPPPPAAPVPLQPQNAHWHGMALQHAKLQQQQQLQSLPRPAAHMNEVRHRLLDSSFLATEIAQDSLHPCLLAEDCCSGCIRTAAGVEHRRQPCNPGPVSWEAARHTL